MSNYSILASIILKKLDFLPELGLDRFRMMLKSVNSDDWVEFNGDKFLKFDFKSRESEREISISYFSDAENSSFLFITTFFEKNGHCFSLKTWLKENDRKQLINISSKHFKDTISEEDFINQFAVSFEKLCRNELKEVIDGTRWDEVPFDWMGYK